MSDLEDLKQAAQIVDEKKKQSDEASISDFIPDVDAPVDALDGALDLAGSVLGGVVDAGGTVLQGVAQVGGTALEGITQVGCAVAEHAGDVAEVAVDAVGALIGGLLDS